MQPAHEDRSQRIEIPSLYQHTGIQTHPDQRPLWRWSNVSSDSGPDKYLILFQWDIHLKFLQVEAEALVGNQKLEFRSDREAIRRLLSEYGMPETQMPPGLIQGEFDEPTHHFMSAEVPRKASSQNEPQIITRFTIDTGMKEFIDYGRWRQEQIKANRSPAGEPLKVHDPYPPRIHVLAYFRDENGAAPILAASNKVILDLSPSETMPKYKGFIAVDLGNTNSTLVCMPDDRGDTESIEVIGHDPTSEEPIPTAICIEQFTPPEPMRTSDRNAVPGMPQSEFKIGPDATTASGGNLVLGAKRLLAAPKENKESHPVWIGNRKCEIPRTLPAELFITGMLRTFQSRKLARPTRIAVTCPTTFSDREIHQLKEVVYHAWRRANGFRDYAFKLESFNTLIPLVIDEASAAALFFIYRDFLRGPGGMPALRYAYPDGVNLLLYDCGGGTTDIALVRVKLHANNANYIERLDLEVLGRAGLRNFGGDNITESVFRVLKAKMACEMSSTGARNRGASAKRFPDDPSQIPAFLRDNRNEFDNLVPTRFDRKRIDLEQNRIRMDVALEFWNWAERVKRQLGEKEELEPKYVRESKLELALKNMDNSQRVDVGLKLSRTEVDTLIQESVAESIRKANHLIAARLPDGGEVHRVYLIGNASRYPLLQSMMRRDLKVRFLGEPGDARGRLIVDSRNLKHAVAKGAVIALRLGEENLRVAVRFDNKLIERLPYDIGYENLGGGGIQLVYHAHELFDELEETAIAVPPPDPDSNPSLKKLSLHRRWPGETKWEHFMDFVFEQAFEGPLMLRHRKNPPDPPYFVLKDEGRSSGEEVIGVEKSDAEYVSPAQRGDL